MSADSGFRVAEWLKAQTTLAEAQRTGRGVIVTTASGVYGPAIVQTSRRGMTALRSGREVWTLWLLEIESVAWAPASPEVGS